jgi:aromatic-L-amino-acid decarboxylase
MSGNTCMKPENPGELLPKRVAAVEILPEDFRRIGHRLIDQLADFLSGMPGGPLTSAETPAQIRQAIASDRALPEQGADPEEIASQAAELMFAHSLFNGHPRFFGYITSSATPIGALGDLIASVVNSNVGAWKLSPAASEIEAQTIRWIAEFIGYPAGCGGLLVSGGNMANFVCFLAARAAATGPEMRETGVGALPKPLRCYCSAETHTWIQKAADLSGLGTDSIRWIPCDHRQRLTVSALREQIERDRDAGEQPFLVVGTAGSVSTGAVDPLPELAALCRELGLWFHVDGAYGGLAAKVPGVPPDLAGLALADSVVVDPHKWLYAPLEAGCVLVRNVEHLRNAFSYHPSYYSFEGEATNYYDLGPQNSRGFRALKIWMAFQQAGRRGFLETVASDIWLCVRAAERLRHHPDFEVFTQNLSICTFRYVPRTLRRDIGSAETESLLNRLNQALLNEIETGGKLFLSNALIDGSFLLRMCIVNFRTSLADVESLPDAVAEVGAQVFAHLRKS